VEPARHSLCCSPRSAFSSFDLLLRKLRLEAPSERASYIPLAPTQSAPPKQQAAACEPPDSRSGMRSEQLGNFFRHRQQPRHRFERPPHKIRVESGDDHPLAKVGEPGAVGNNVLPQKLCLVGYRQPPCGELLSAELRFRSWTSSEGISRLNGRRFHSLHSADRSPA